MHQHRWKCSCGAFGFALMRRLRFCDLVDAAAQSAFVPWTLGFSEEHSWPAGASFSHVGADGRACIQRMWGPFFSEIATKMDLIPVTEHTGQRPPIAAPADLTAAFFFLFNSGLCFIAFTVVIAQMGPLNTAGTIVILYPCGVPAPPHCWFHRVLFGSLKL